MTIKKIIGKLEAKTKDKEAFRFIDTARVFLREGDTELKIKFPEELRTKPQDINGCFRARYAEVGGGRLYLVEFFLSGEDNKFTIYQGNIRDIQPHEVYIIPDYRGSI